MREVRTVLRADSAAARVFWSTTPAVLETYGFVLGTLENGAQFHAPDERALLSEEFARTHCFEPARGGGPDSTWLGIRFAPIPRRDVPEIAGVVWLDSATAEPRRVEYAFRWRDLPRAARGIAGATEFARMPTGELAVHAWRMRVPRVDSYVGRLRLIGYSEFGGTLADSARRRVRVAGLVYDSLVGAPLAGALVTRAGAAEVATTDSAGRFALDSVDAAPGYFVFSHPALDDAGLADLVVPADLSAAHDSARVTLATPSAASVWGRACGGVPPAPRAAILSGVVRDAATGAPVPDGGVTVAWTSLDTVDHRVVATPRRRTLRADSTGAFRVCGVPTGTELEVQGAAERTTSGWAVVAAGARGLAAVDLLVPPPAAGLAAGGPSVGPAAAPPPVATTSVTGVVRDSLGVARPGVRVTVDGAPALAAITDADGAFRFAQVPAGTQTFVVRAVGYAPLAVSVGLRTTGSEPVEITLRRITRLATVAVSGRAGSNSAFLTELARRRRLGIGTIVDSTLIRQAPEMHSLLRRIPGAVVSMVGPAVLGLVTTTGCPIAVAVDDRVTTWEEVADLSTDHVLAVEVYRRTTQVPARFQGLLVQAAVLNRSGNPVPCGLALVWTRGAR